MQCDKIQKINQNTQTIKIVQHHMCVYQIIQCIALQCILVFNDISNLSILIANIIKEEHIFIFYFIFS